MLGQKSSISKEMLDGCKEAYSCLDKLLEGKKWLVGNSYTLADINCVTVASSISVSFLIFIKTNITTFRGSDNIFPNVISRF